MMEFSSKHRAALNNVLEFCRLAVDLNVAGEVLDQMDLSDWSFEESLDVLDELLKRGDKIEG